MFFFAGARKGPASSAQKSLIPREGFEAKLRFAHMGNNFFRVKEPKWKFFGQFSPENAEVTKLHGKSAEKGSRNAKKSDGSNYSGGSEGNIYLFFHVTGVSF